MPERLEQAALLRLMSWLSPTFPVGAFAYSHGLEQAVHDALIHDRSSLVLWLGDLLARGSGWNDAVLLAEAWRKFSAGDDAADVAELARAMSGSRERHMETDLQGAAFGAAMADWKGDVERGVEPSAAAPYPIAVAGAAAAQDIPLEATLAAYLHAFTSNLVQAALRLVPLGQRDGVMAMAALEATLLDVARRAASSSLDDLGSATLMSEIAAMKHETLYSRVFRS